MNDMRKPNNVVRVPCALDINFFKAWLTFLKPLHELTDREIDVAACFLFHRWELSLKISDTSLVNQVLFNEDTKKKIKEECSLTTQYFHVILGKLKKAKLIVDGVINPSFIPNIVTDDDGFLLLILFDFKDVKPHAL